MKTEDQVLDVVRQLASELNPTRDFSQLGQSAHLEYDLGIGSLERLELSVRLERALGRPVPGEVVLQARLCADLLKNGPAPSASRETPVLTTPGRLVYPTQAATLVEMLVHQARHQPEMEALVWQHEGRHRASRTYPQLLDEVRAIAGGLLARGVRPGDRVGLMLPTSTDFVASLFAILWRGAIPVPMYPPFRADQIEDHVRRQAAIMRNAGVRLLIAFAEMKAASHLLRLNAPCLEAVAEVAELRGQTLQSDAAECGGSDIALIQYTSGSTGQPKGVMLSHANILANVRAYRCGLEMGPGDVCVSWLPLYHDMGLIGTLFGALYYSVPMVMLAPQDFLAQPSRWLKAIHEYRGTISAAPNFAYELCARRIPESELEGLDLSCWRVALNGAEMVRPETVERFLARFSPYGFRPESMMPVYGLAEATLAVTFPPVGRPPQLDVIDRELLEREDRAWPAADGLKFMSCGRVLEQIGVRIVDAQGRKLDDRRVGMVQFRSPASLEGYWGSSAPVKDAEGWVSTGDRGYIADGELYIVGRTSNLILKGGRNLHAEDVEEAVFEVPGTRRGCAAAFALPDPETGSEQLVIVAETRLKGKAEREALEQAVRRRVAETLAVPADRVVLVPPQSVPKTPSGKVRRLECRSLYLSGRLGQRRSAVVQALSLVFQGLKEKAGWPVRAVYGAAWGAGIAMLGSALLAVGRFSPAAAQRLAPSFCRWLLHLFGIRVTVEGPEPPRGAFVLVSNHTARFDPFLLLAASSRPLHFLVAPWVARGPLAPLMEPLGHLTVQRGAEDLEQMQQVLRNGKCLAAFPEGGLEHAPGLRPFTLGVFQAAAREGKPIVPVTLQGSRELMPDRLFVPRPGRVRIIFSEPIESAGDSWSDVVALAGRARQCIAAHCGEPLCERRLRREE